MKIEIGTNEAGQRLDKFLRKYLKDVPLSAIFKALRKGDIRVNGAKKKENYSLELGDVIEIRYIQSKQEKKEDSFIKAPCNRLDRNTSGVVIFGKNFESLRTMNEMIREGKVKKYYNALVKGKIKDGIYKGYISKNENENISRVYDEKKPNTKEISMEVKTVQTNGAYSLLEIDLITGRSHQIRAHLSHLGNPIIGDFKYGDRKLNSFFDNKFGLNYQFLYAYKLIFKGADGKLEYLKNKTIAESLPPMFKKIKKDVFKFTI